MIIFSIVMGMIGAFYSMFIVNIYTRLSARARDAGERSNDIVRFLLFISVVPVLFCPPWLAMEYAKKMFSSESSPMIAQQKHSTAIWMFVGVGLLLGFMITRRRVLMDRLRRR